MNKERTIFGWPIRKCTTEAFYPDKTTLDDFVEQTKKGLDGFRTNMINLGEKASSPKFIEDWFETFMAWSEVEEERDIYKW